MCVRSGEWKHQVPITDRFKMLHGLILGFHLESATAVMVQSIHSVSTHMLVNRVRYELVTFHIKKTEPPPSLAIMCLETIESSHAAFHGKVMGPPAHRLEEKSSGTSIMEMQNTQWSCSTMWGHFIHSVPLSPF